jgi:hypothetical protein
MAGFVFLGGEVVSTNMIKGVTKQFISFGEASPLD